ncbi:hypothetical protein CONCODRAFT_17455 [Conidiobolus coronatus NRRL 28638]|uniref:F-box domain-containing protein n=1 Tax=Conidiobolus coronatus (strain ATCC 28846 / CBS 209.66 / NRRL 28638) TaxID=796925 RepID=A0A137P6P9_CONC2|nr:hypothetical protein CONCODRAFT_17455 [Conidiobolus coronatus NRRL 28638]|eukprot:KXN70676.1 hypothetical protein CONCODRAFT_17455 [Conidiobolus coronatus NRRL 28638]
MLDWTDIALWKDLSCYLSQSDIIKLSLLSKLWRFKLAQLVFRKIGYRGTIKRNIFNQSYEYIYRKKTDKSSEEISDNEKGDGENDFGSDDDICNCDKNPEVVHRYNCKRIVSKRMKEVKKETEIVRIYATDLSVSEYTDSFPLQFDYNTKFIFYFSNLKCLNLNYTRFYLLQLNSMFSKLEKLESLTLIQVGVIDLFIKKGIIIQKETDRKYFVGFVELFEDGGPYFSIKPQYLPNLRRLKYINIRNNFDDTMIEFLVLNPQLSYLSSAENAFTASLLNQISLQPSLKQLDIIKENEIYIPYNLSDSYTLASIQYLHINVDSSEDVDFFIKISLACCNISRLNLEIQHCSNTLAENVALIISQLKKLNTLSININYDIINFIKLMTKGSNIQNLQLVNYSLEDLDLSLIDQHSKIRKVHISYSNPICIASQVKLAADMNKYLNWSILSFHDSITCYKTLIKLL